MRARHQENLGMMKMFRVLYLMPLSGDTLRLKWYTLHLLMLKMMKTQGDTKHAKNNTFIEITRKAVKTLSTLLLTEK